MSQHYEEPVPESFVPGSDADINVFSIVMTGVVGAIITVVIVLALKALYYQTQSNEQAAKAAQYGDIRLSDVQASQLEQINGYRWVDPKAGKLAIPIDRAMERVLDESRRAGAGNHVVQWSTLDQTPVPGNLLNLQQRQPDLAELPAQQDAPVVELTNEHGQAIRHGHSHDHPQLKKSAMTLDRAAEGEYAEHAEGDGHAEHAEGETGH
jgi:hypothetical protein